MSTETEDIKRILREWIDGEKELKKMRATVRHKNKVQTNVLKSLSIIMKKLDIDSFDTKEGEVNLKQRKTTKAMSGKFILTTLTQYLANNPIQNAEDITKYLLDNRVVTFKDIITLK